MKRLLVVLSVCLLGAFFHLNAEIIETTQMAQILPVSKDALILFDVDDTLIDSSITLGTAASRAYLKEQIAAYEMNHGKPWKGKLYDLLTYVIAQKVLVIPVEPDIPVIIHKLQDRNEAAFAFTARGASQWYSTTINGVDILTMTQLVNVNIYFGRSRIPPPLKDALNYGILFANQMNKGVFLRNLFDRTGYRPTKVIFVDDKLDQVQAVEQAMNEMDIPFTGFWYRRAAAEHSTFDPVIATIQLRELIQNGVVLDDAAAGQIKKQRGYTNADLLFGAFMNWVIQQLTLHPHLQDFIK